MPWRTEYPREATVHGLFIEAALTNPDAIAIESEEGSVTYVSLLGRAQGISAGLRRRGVGAGTLVGVAAERSTATIAAILGILLAGGVYVPLELQGSPAQLLQRQVRTSGVSLLLCDQSFRTQDWAQPWWRGCELLPIAQLENELLPAGSDFVPFHGAATDPAYVMFTSGSTGQPKGVVVPHRGIVRLIAAQDFLDFGPEETFLLHSPLGFDASTLEIWGSLLHGARLAIAPGGTLAVNDFERIVVRYGVTTLWLTASVFHLVADHAPGTFRPLKQLIVGGDVVSPQRVKRTVTINPDLQVVNGYGPTENTTFTSCYRVPQDYQAVGSLPIGKAIRGTEVHVLDSELRPVPAGEVGELAAGGDGVALGYLDAPEVTASRFVADPFSLDPAARLYLTGDRVRLRHDGNIEFLGRADQEVKIAGRRIDLKEVEEELGRHPLVEQVALAVSKGDQEEKRLYAFVHLRETLSGAPAVLKDYLAGRVTAAAVPSRIVEVESLPLNANGKVDRERLLNSLAENSAQASFGEKWENSEPGEDTSSVGVVLGVWRHLLRREKIGIDENFFDAGGTSLLLMELHIELNKRFPGKLSLMDLFGATTVRKMSERLAPVRIGYENATFQQHKARIKLGQ